MSTEDGKIRERLIAAVVAGAGAGGMPKDELDRICEWTDLVAYQYALLGGVAAGDIVIRFPAGADEPLFSLTDKGEDEANRILDETDGLDEPR